LQNGTQIPSLNILHKVIEPFTQMPKNLRERESSIKIEDSIIYEFNSRRIPLKTLGTRIKSHFNAITLIADVLMYSDVSKVIRHFVRCSKRRSMDSVELLFVGFHRTFCSRNF
jgi:hypothetical protein